MLYYGTSDMLQYLSSDTVIFNLTSYREDIPRLNLLPPLDKKLYKDGGRDFDLWYAQYIFDNDVIFYEFFKIVYQLYNGNDVFLVASSMDWSENMVESILKLIQQRYGYNGSLIDSFESYIYAKNNMISGFNPDGLYNLDMDKNRFSIMMTKINPDLLKLGTEDDNDAYK